MRGADRCDEIVRLIDEALGEVAAPAAVLRAEVPAGAVEREERRRLLAVVGDFLAGCGTEGLVVA